MSWMITANTEYLPQVVDALPEVVRKALQEKNVCVAGGFIRDVISGKKPSDVDMFGEEWPFGKEEVGYRVGMCVTFTRVAQLPVQWVKISGEYAAHVCTKFDLTNCQVWLEWDRERGKWRLQGTTQAWTDLKEGVFHFNPTGGSVCKSYWHMAKLIRKGYMPGMLLDPENLTGVVAGLLAESKRFQSTEFIDEVSRSVEDHIWAKAPDDEKFLKNGKLQRDVVLKQMTSPNGGQVTEVDAYGNPRPSMAEHTSAPREVTPSPEREGVPVGGRGEVGNRTANSVPSWRAPLSGMDTGQRDSEGLDQWYPIPDEEGPGF
jgi:hypothetical protein